MRRYQILAWQEFLEQIKRKQIQEELLVPCKFSKFFLLAKELVTSSNGLSIVVVLQWIHGSGVCNAWTLLCEV